MDSLKLLTYVSVIAIVLATIGYIAILTDLYGDRLHSLWTRIMDRVDKALGRGRLGRRVEELDWEEEYPDPEDLPNINPEWTDEGLKVTVTQPNGTKSVIEYDKETTQEIEDDFGMDFLSDKFKEGDKKVANGEISCNLDNPEDCINCGS